MDVKGCPFCGAAPRIKEQSVGTWLEAYFIGCSNPECEAEIRKPYFKKEEALRAWNTRADLTDCEMEPDKETPMFLQDGKQAQNTESLLKLYGRMEEKYGKQTIWVALLLVAQIDMKTWKFPEQIHKCRFHELVEEIEQDNELREAFQAAACEKEVV